MKPTTNRMTQAMLDGLKRREPMLVDQTVRQLSPQLYRAGIGMGFAEHEALDLVQSVWLTFFHVLPSFRGDSSVRTFLFGILYNKALELRRQSARYETQTDDDVDEFDTQGHWIVPPIDPERFVLAAEKLGVINQCMETLPLQQKLAFVLSEIEEQDTQDICKILNVSRTNLGVLLHRARRQLRRCIEAEALREG